MAAPKLTAEETKEIIELFESGTTCKEIADLYGRQYGTIWKFLDRNGLLKKDNPKEDKVFEKKNTVAPPKKADFDARREVLPKKETRAIEQAFNIRRGDIYYILKKGSTDGSVMDSGRPAIVVSNDKNNVNADIVEIVYFTTQPKKNMPTHVGIRSTGIYSTAICEQILTVPKERVVKLCGVCTDAEMKAIDAALIASLGLNFESVTAPAEVYSATFVEEEEINTDYQEVVFERDTYKRMYEELLDKLVRR